MFCRDHAARDRIKWSVFQYATYGRPVLHDAYRLVPADMSQRQSACGALSRSNRTEECVTN
jgi:hypothetical protein